MNTDISDKYTLCISSLGESELVNKHGVTI